jgi:hypothetical protein
MSLTAPLSASGDSTSPPPIGLVVCISSAKWEEIKGQSYWTVIQCERRPSASFQVERFHDSHRHWHAMRNHRSATSQYRHAPWQSYLVRHPDGSDGHKAERGVVLFDFMPRRWKMAHSVHGMRACIQAASPHPHNTDILRHSVV